MQANSFMVSLVGPLAMTSYEPRQARKGAAVITHACAGVWLAGDTSNCVIKWYWGGFPTTLVNLTNLTNLSSSIGLTTP